MSEELRYSMTAAALEIGRKLGYVGAGTVEFILVSCKKEEGFKNEVDCILKLYSLGRKITKVLLFGSQHTFASRARYHRSYFWTGSC
jgi:pyruvate carboxylase